MRGCAISQQQERIDTREGLVELVNHLIFQEAVASEGGLCRMHEHVSQPDLSIRELHRHVSGILTSLLSKMQPRDAMAISELPLG